MPNDYIDLKYQEQLNTGTITQEQVDKFKEMYGIGDKSFMGIINGYLNWLGHMLKGDFGRSFKFQVSVTQVITENMWISFAIEVYIIFFVLLLSFVGVKFFIEFIFVFSLSWE